MDRYFGAKQRRAGKRCKGPTKRTNEMQDYFLRQLKNLIINKC